ncbi:MAG: hypothetical protein CL464_05190 [Acidimicrobiaceae bacterium]|nr:hypothetical protein [Acidimicrobiaceae bacterium]
MRDFAEEPDSLGEDDSIAALLDAAEDIVNSAGPDIMLEIETERLSKGRRRPRMSKKNRAKKRKKGKKR